MKTLLRRVMGTVPALAMVLAVFSVTTPCHFFVHQPDVPNELKEYET